MRKLSLLVAVILFGAGCAGQAPVTAPPTRTATAMATDTATATATAVPTRTPYIPLIPSQTPTITLTPTALSLTTLGTSQREQQHAVIVILQESCRVMCASGPRFAAMRRRMSSGWMYRTRVSKPSIR